MKNRLIGAICAAVMLLALFAPMAMADGVCGESVSWTLTDAGVLTVFGTGEMTNFAAGEAPWYAERGAVRKLVVENGGSCCQGRYLSPSTVLFRSGASETVRLTMCTH